MNTQAVTVAIPRGSLMSRSLELFEAVGYDVAEVRANDRKLYFAEQRIVTTRPSDVPTYVERGVADIGIAGKDVLMEQADREIYELVDLDFGGCEMVVAVVEGADGADSPAEKRRGTLRVATSYPRIAEDYFARTGRQVEIVQVKGSVELAAIAGLADAIVDLTATGTTLRENGLVISERIASSTARLIANPGAYRLKSEAIDAIASELARVAPDANG